MSKIDERQCRFGEIDRLYLDLRIREAKKVIRESLKRTDKPLVVQFSGGRDSMALLSLTMEVTDNYICGFMKTDIDLPGSFEFALSSAKALGIDLFVSDPRDHLGGFFSRLPLFGWPTVRRTWCNRDLKVRPQQKMLNREFGKGDYYKLVGVRKYESPRRKKMHSANRYIVADYNTTGHLVYPILLWNQYDILNYLKSRGLPTSRLYKSYGVSGCYWCPFYQPAIYKKIMLDYPYLYDRFIQLEETYGPSVQNHVYLRDIKSPVKGGATFGEVSNL